MKKLLKVLRFDQIKDHLSSTDTAPQPTNAPTRKVSAAVLATFLKAVIGVVVWNVFNVELDTEVSGWIVGFIIAGLESFPPLAAYIAKEKVRVIDGDGH